MVARSDPSATVTILLSSSVSFVEGVTGLCLLVALQATVAFMSTRIPILGRLVRSRPALLMVDGVPHKDVMLRERVSAEALHQAIRSSGSGGSDQVAAVVLETDGSLSIIPTESVGSGDALADVQGWNYAKSPPVDTPEVSDDSGRSCAP